MGKFGLLFLYQDGLVIGFYKNGKIPNFRGLDGDPKLYNLKDNMLLVIEAYEDKTGVKFKQLERISLQMDKIDDLMVNDGIYDLAEQIFKDFII